MALAHLKLRNRRASRIVPYGFRLNGGLVEADPSEQRTLVFIRHMHRNGFSTRRMGPELTKLGMSPRSGSKWRPKVVMDLCRRAQAVSPSATTTTWLQRAKMASPRCCWTTDSTGRLLPYVLVNLANDAVH